MMKQIGSKSEGRLQEESQHDRQTSWATSPSSREGCFILRRKKGRHLSWHSRPQSPSQAPGKRKEKKQIAPFPSEFLGQAKTWYHLHCRMNWYQSILL